MVLGIRKVSLDCLDHFLQNLLCTVADGCASGATWRFIVSHLFLWHDPRNREFGRQLL